MMKLLLTVIALLAPALAYKMGGGEDVRTKVDREEDTIVARIFAEIRGIKANVDKIEARMDNFEVRLNKSLEEPPTTTTMMPAWKYRVSPYVWVPPTTTKSPQEVCADMGGFICYNDSTTCVNATKVCDKIPDCEDESDECFCSAQAPEQIIDLSECPHGFFGSKTLKKCYWFSSPSTQANWIDALVDCTKRAAKMVAIESRLEQEAIVRFLNKHGFANTSVWLGATNMLRSGVAYYSTNDWAKHWMWLANDVFFANSTYLNWVKTPVQPDNRLNNEYCLEMRYDFEWLWNDKDCKSLNPYVCQIDMPDGQRQFPEPEAESDHGEW